MRRLRRGSGYCLDVGASELVSNGSIKLPLDVTETQIEPRSVALDNGWELPADFVVYATGSGPTNGHVAQVISQRGDDTIGTCSKPRLATAEDWPLSGRLAQSGSPRASPACGFTVTTSTRPGTIPQFLALQLKARLELERTRRCTRSWRWITLPDMPDWIYFIHPPRDNFAATMTPAEVTVWGEHFERLKRLLAAGTLILAGPTLGPVNTGIAIFEASDEAAATSIMQDDPIVQGGYARAELRPFRTSLLRGRT
jgi:uncharacterized protein YciI